MKIFLSSLFKLVLLAIFPLLSTLVINNQQIFTHFSLLMVLTLLEKRQEKKQEFQNKS